MKTRLSPTGHIKLPDEYLSQDGISPGQAFEIKRLGPGEYVLKSLPTKSLIDWLMECPEKDWFTPMKSESMDSGYYEYLDSLFDAPDSV